MVKCWSMIYEFPIPEDYFLCCDEASFSKWLGLLLQFRFASERQVSVSARLRGQTGFLFQLGSVIFTSPQALQHNVVQDEAE